MLKTFQNYNLYTYQYIYIYIYQHIVSTFINYIAVTISPIDLLHFGLRFQQRLPHPGGATHRGGCARGLSHEGLPIAGSQQRAKARAWAAPGRPLKRGQHFMENIGEANKKEGLI